MATTQTTATSSRELAMLEQIAQRFETYARDQEIWMKRGVGNRSNRAIRAEIWRDAAKELREIGEINREAFLKDVLELVNPPEAAPEVLALFITGPTDGQ